MQKQVDFQKKLCNASFICYDFSNQWRKYPTMHKELTYTINGCLFKIHSNLGSIWKEKTYEKALELELHSQGLKAECQKKFHVFYFDKRVGSYSLDVLVEDKVIVELKAVPITSPLHKAQLISYLKGYDKPLGILANFGCTSLDHHTYPNKLHLKTPLRDSFDFDKVQTEGKGDIKELLLMANRILINLGAGYFHQIYRKAFYYELKSAGISFHFTKDIFAKYHNETLGSKEVNFFIIGDLLLSVIAVKELDSLLLSKFKSYIRYFKLKRGLIFNFNALHLDFRYLRGSVIRTE